MKCKRWDEGKKEWKHFEVRVFLGDPEKVRAADTVMGRFDLGFTPAFDYPDLGVEVDSVVQGGSADQAGLRVGDVIVRIDDRRVKSHLELKEALALKKPWQEVTLTLLRDGKRIEKKLKLREHRKK